jgi:hypothetical protein
MSTRRIEAFGSGGCRSALSRGIVALSILPACDMVPYCPAGQTRWQCSIQATACHMAYVNYVCAGDMQSAIVAANKEAILRLKPQDQNIVGTTCKNTGDVRAPLNVEPPKVRPQGARPAIRRRRTMAASRAPRSFAASSTWPVPRTPTAPASLVVSTRATRSRPARAPSTAARRRSPRSRRRTASTWRAVTARGPPASAIPSAPRRRTPGVPALLWAGRRARGTASASHVTAIQSPGPAIDPGPATRAAPARRRAGDGAIPSPPGGVVVGAPSAHAAR